MTFNRIVAGMDFSEPAINAATWVARQFAPDAEMILVHVVDPPDRPLFGRHLLPEASVVEASAREYATRRMAEVEKLLEPARCRFETRVGKPHEQISTVARELAADLIVIGPHGDRPRPWKLLGTAAERLVRTSTVPVLVATNPPTDRPRKLLVPVDDVSETPAVLEWTR